jgi:hypothetical protein
MVSQLHHPKQRIGDPSLGSGGSGSRSVTGPSVSRVTSSSTPTRDDDSGPPLPPRRNTNTPGGDGPGLMDEDDAAAGGGLDRYKPLVPG